jgi:FkbM family methyltransferase
MYSDLIEIRDVMIDGETNWHFIKGDTGGFDGPKGNWIDCHRTSYFEHVKNFDTVVTAGTNCGLYARHYSKKFKHVYAFEPEPIAFHCMVNNCQSDNVVKLNAALGHGFGLVGINRVPPGGHEMNVGMNTLSPPTEQFKIPMFTVDSLCLDACDLIQLDVEGFEQYAIMGAKTTIDKFKPVIIAERFSSLEHQNFMLELGYILSSVSAMDSIYIPKVENKSQSFFVYKT